jgi:hypothetical protein
MDYIVLAHGIYGAADELAIIAGIIVLGLLIAIPVSRWINQGDSHEDTPQDNAENELID